MHPIIAEDIENLMHRLSSQLKCLAGGSFLITGANGMIASYLVDILMYANKSILSQNPVSVTAITKNPVQLDGRLGHLLDGENIRFICADVSQQFEIPNGITHIVHAASWANPKKYLAHPIETMDTNVIGAQNLLRYTIRSPIKKILFLSSVEIYGNPESDAIPTPETYIGRVDPIGMRSCYAEAKRYVECLAVHHYRIHSIPAVIARLSHTYGPGLSPDDSRVIGAFMRYALAGKPIEIFSDGLEERTFSYVSDTCAGLIYLLAGGSPGEAYNIGSDRDRVTMKELATLITEDWSLNLLVRHIIDPMKKQYLAGAPLRVEPDLTKLRALGWRPEIPLCAGLSRMRSWLLENV